MVEIRKQLISPATKVYLIDIHVLDNIDLSTTNGNGNFLKPFLSLQLFPKSSSTIRVPYSAIIRC